MTHAHSDTKEPPKERNTRSMHLSHASTPIELMTHPRIAASTPAMRVVERIRQWPHWSVIAQVAAKAFQLSTEDFDCLLPEYQRFLALCITHEYSISMLSVQVDVLWHAHVRRIGDRN